MAVGGPPERPALRALRASIYDAAHTAGRDTRKADDMVMISFAGNRYSVPAEYAGTTVGVVVTATNRMVRDLATGDLIARHRIPSTKSQTTVATHHRVPRGLAEYVNVDDARSLKYLRRFSA